MNYEHFKLIREQTGLIPIYYMLATEDRWYNRLEDNRRIEEKNVEEFKEPRLEIVVAGGEIKGLDRMKIPEKANALVLVLGNASMKPDGEHCQTLFAKISE